jgi:DNA-binding transcriptional ArsR family regulator
MAIRATDQLSEAFRALADPTRRAILAKLAAGDADVTELVKPFNLSQPTISKHLKVLERAGLVSRGQDAQRRPRRLVATPLQRIDQWLQTYRHSWEEQFASLDDYLHQLQAKEIRGGRAKRTRR